MSSSSVSAPHLVAVSVGQPRDFEWQGRPLRTGIQKSPVAGRVAAGPLGLAGDAQADLSVHGGIDKAVYAYDDANTAWWRETLARPDLGPGSFGENLTLHGWPDERVYIGDRFRIGSACFEVSQPRQPCHKLGMRFGDPGFPKRFLRSRRVGYYLRVVEPGEIGAGDAVVRVAHDPTSMDVSSLAGILVARQASRAELERAAGLAALADAWRIPFQERLDALHGAGAG